MTLTQAQEDAILQIKHIAREHFTGSLIVLLSAGDTNEEDDHIRVTFHGGYSIGIGLAELGKQELLNREYKRDDL